MTTNSTINIKTSTAIAIIGVLVSGVLGWTFKEAYSDYKRQNTKQWEMISKLKEDVAWLKAKAGK